MRVMLRRAGRPDVDTDRYLAIRVLSILASPLVAIVAWRLAASQDEMLRVAITGLAGAGCTVLPSRKLRTEVEDREAKILRPPPRSEERRVGEERCSPCRSRWWPDP